MPITEFQEKVAKKIFEYDQKNKSDFTYHDISYYKIPFHAKLLYLVKAEQFIIVLKELKQDTLKV